MPSHCGVDLAQIDGRRWRAIEGSLFHQSSVSAGRQLGNPNDDGSIVVESATRAIYVASEGTRIAFRNERLGDAPSLTEQCL
jgi:hypothetical protein